MSLMYCADCNGNIDTDYDTMYSETECMKCHLNDDIVLDKFNVYIKANPYSDDSNLKRLNKLNEIEALNTKERMKKIDGLMVKMDREAEKIKKVLS